jgi:hypothetical protein
VRVRSVALSLLVVLAGTFAAPMTCVGWESGAADRQACCKRAQHEHCRDQSAADDCCAKHERGRFGTPAPSIAASGLTVDSAVLPHGAFAPLAAIPDGAALAHASRPFVHAPPDLFSPPLRI